MQNEQLFNQSENFIDNSSKAVNQAITILEDSHDKLVKQTKNLNTNIANLNTSISALKFLRAQVQNSNSSSANITVTALDIQIFSLEALRNSTEQQRKDALNETIQLEQLNVTLQSIKLEISNYATQISLTKQINGNEQAKLIATLVKQIKA